MVCWWDCRCRREMSWSLEVGWSRRAQGRVWGWRKEAKNEEVIYCPGTPRERKQAASFDLGA